MLIVRSNLSARSEKKVLKEQLLFWGKKRVQGCVSENSDPMNSILREAEELGLNALAGHTMKFLGCDWYGTEFGKEGSDLEELSEEVNLMSEILARSVLRNNTWGNLTISRLWQQRSVEFGWKMHNAEEERSKLTWNGYLEMVQKPFYGLTETGKVQINENAQVFVHGFDLFVTVRLLDETPAVLLLLLLCSKTRISIWPRLSSIPAAVCLQHRDRQISKSIPENWDYYQIQSRLEVGNRCWQIPTSGPRGTLNQHTKNISDEMYKEDPVQDIPDWLQPFTVDLEDLEFMCSHIPLKQRTQIRKATLQKWRYNNGSTVFKLTSANTEKDLFHEQKRLVTWKQQSTKVNLGTITSSLPWYKISQFSVYYLCETKTSQETDRNFTKVSGAVTEAKSYFYERFIRIWQVLWRIIMESSPHCSEKRNCRTSCASSKRRDISLVIAWTKIWGIIWRTSCIIWRIDWTAPRTPKETKHRSVNKLARAVTKWTRACD